MGEEGTVRFGALFDYADGRLSIECARGRFLEDAVTTMGKGLGEKQRDDVPGNSQSVSLFRDEIVRRWFKVLRRRSQRYTITWERFSPWIRQYLPKVRVVHPYPELRFRAKYSK